MARAVAFFGDDDLGTVAGMVVEALSCGDEMCVFICNALKVFRRLLARGVHFSIEVLARIVVFAHVCPTSDAAKALSAYFQFQREEALQFASEVFDSLLGAIECHLEGQEDDSPFLHNLLVVLSQIIQASDGFVFQESSFPVFTGLLERFRARHSAYELGLCFTAVFSTDGPHCLSFFNLLLNAIQSNHDLFHGMAHLAPAIQVLLTRVSASLDMLIAVIQLCLETLSEGVGPAPEKAVVDLLCAIVQMNPSIDLAPVVELCGRRLEGRVLLVSSLYLLGRIDMTSEDLRVVSDAAETAPCPYEKVLFALVLIQVVVHHPELASELLPAVFALVRAESAQREELGNDASVLRCSHNLPFPVQTTDINETLMSLAPICPPELQVQIVAFCSGEPVQ
jgi:hypothetical protein